MTNEWTIRSGKLSTGPRIARSPHQPPIDWKHGVPPERVGAAPRAWKSILVRESGAGGGR
jgi:hypothetical protein